MSRNSSGTYSLPAGNPVVSGTTISSAWGNSTLSDVATEITNSLDRGGRGAMTAPLKLAAGSVSAPALAFSAEAASGLYRAGSHDVRLSVDSADIQSWSASGASFPVSAAFPAGATFAVGLTLSGSYPSSSTAFQNVLTPANLPKAWATFKTNGSGAVSVLAGFNLTASIVGSSVRVTFAQPFANVNYAVLGGAVPAGQPTIGPAGLGGSSNKTTTTCDLLGSSGGVFTNFATAAVEFYALFFGAQ